MIVYVMIKNDSAYYDKKAIYLTQLEYYYKYNVCVWCYW